MDLAQAFIFDAGWLFFAAWGLVLVLVSVIAFGRDISSLLGDEAISTPVRKLPQ
jgi:hypothetical protein